MGPLVAGQPIAHSLKAQLQLASVWIDMKHCHRQQLAWRWILPVGMTHQIHRQIRHVNQRQPVLRA